MKKGIFLLVFIFIINHLNAQYCSSYGNTDYDTGITLVKFNTINNSDASPKDNGYEDFTGISTDLTQEVTYDLTVNVDTDGGYRVDVLVWIDWNQDGDFTDSGEEYDLGNTSSDGITPSSPYSIFVPSTASIGNTRMRVSVRFDNNPTSCETDFDGEVEDYTVNILSSTPAPEISITGLGSSIVTGDATPTVTDGTDFGSVDLGSTGASVFEITNSGSLPLSIGAISFSGANSGDFTIVSPPTSSVSSGSSTSFTVEFSPGGSGVRTGVISIVNNDTTGGEDPFTFTLTGEGVTGPPKYTAYYENFDISNGGWTPITSTNDSWAWADSFPISDELAEGSFWRNTNFNNYSNNSRIVIESPSYDFTGLENLRFSLDVKYETEDDDDGMRVLYSVGGGSYTLLGTSGSGVNWYEDNVSSLGSDGWNNDSHSSTPSFTPYSHFINASISLSDAIFSNQSDVKFRIEFSSNSGTTDNGVAFDNVKIEADPISPLSSSSIGPANITNNLRLWLKTNAGISASDGSSLTQWEDQAFDTTLDKEDALSSSSLAPLYNDNSTKNLNFNPVVEFDNTTTAYMQGKGGYSSQDYFIVLKSNDIVSTQTGSYNPGRQFGIGGRYSEENFHEDPTGLSMGSSTARYTDEIIAHNVNSFPNTSSSPPNDNSYGRAYTSNTDSYDHVLLLNVKANSGRTSTEIYKNGKRIDNTTGVAGNGADLNYKEFENLSYLIGTGRSGLAGRTSSQLNGRLTEIISYTSPNSSISQQKIQSYLAIKYGVTLQDVSSGLSNYRENDVDYLDSSGNVIWDTSLNSGFNYDVAGIGRDDASGLEQKQSKSSNNGSVVTIGLGEVASTNSTNPNSFITDKDFLVWGHNNGALSGSDVLSINLGASATTVTTMFDRRWKIVESRPTISNDILDVKISIPSTILSPISTSEEYALIVSSTATFGSNDIVDVIPLKANGTNYETWYDFDETKYFTFGVASKVTGKYNVEFSSGDFLVGENVVHLNSNFTVSAWVRNLGNGGTLVSKGTEYNFKLNGAGNVEVHTNGVLRATSTFAINDAKWHHVAVTNSGSNLRIYIDGILDVTESAVTLTNTSNKFAIGAIYTDKNNISTTFNGDIDEIRIWDSTLTQSQIQYVMNQEIENDSNNVNGKVLPQSTTLNDINSIPWNQIKAYHNINSFYGTTVEDASNNSNWVRIKYLKTGKNIMDSQSAPLPYVSVDVNTSIPLDWDDTNTWENGNELIIPNVIGLDGTTKIDWNIVETKDDINSGNRSIKLLGLINSEDELSINTPNKLEISHYLLLNGVIDLDGESQLIQTTDSDLDILSTGYLERDQQGVGNKFRYNDWSSPVISNIPPKKYVVASVLKDGTDATNPIDIDFVGGYDGNNTTTPIQIANYWIYKYVNDEYANYSKWVQIGSSGQLKAGEGFLMKGTANPGVLAEQNYVFVGTPNNGDISLHVSGTNNYLVGNPYPSAIDADLFLTDNINTIEGGTIYFWEHYGGNSHNLKNYQAGYGSYNLSGGVKATSHPINDTSAGPGSKTPQRYIAVGQGFFVQGDSDGGDIVFKNSQRTFVTEENPSNSIFMKGGVSSKGNKEEDLDKRLKIRLGFEATKIQHRQLLLTIDERSSEGVDWGFDGPIYEEFKDDMYWLIDEKKFVIQGTNTISVETEIPLGIKSNGGMVKIGVDTIENAPDDFKVYIKDLNSGETFNITQNNFEIELAEGVYKDRFVVAFQPRLKTIQEISVNEGVFVFMNNSAKELQVNKILDTEIQSVSLYNYLGQMVNTWNTNFNERNNSFSVNVSTGAYIVKVHTSEGAIVKKIIIQ